MTDLPAQPAADEAPAAEETAAVEETAVAAEPAHGRRPPGERRRQGGDGLGSLVGGGSSQVGTNGAMRARDVSRPR
jgi:hypothetical protein